jgi:hypothetical protein
LTRAIGATAIQAAHAEHFEINIRLDIPSEFLPKVFTCLNDVDSFIGCNFQRYIKEIETEIPIMQVTKRKIFNFLLTGLIDNSNKKCVWHAFCK